MWKLCLRTYVIAAALICLATTNVSAMDGLVLKASKHSVSESLDRLEKILKSKGITVMARVDHAKNAQNAGLELRPTQLLIFGNPKVGTRLMQSNRKIAIDLPMKVLAWQDNEGRTWLAYTKPEVLRKRHGISGKGILFSRMTAALDKLTNAALR